MLNILVSVLLTALLQIKITAQGITTVILNIYYSDNIKENRKRRKQKSKIGMKISV